MQFVALAADLRIPIDMKDLGLPGNGIDSRDAFRSSTRELPSTIVWLSAHHSLTTSSVTSRHANLVLNPSAITSPREQPR